VSETPYLLATRSAGKLRELRPLFAQYQLRVIDLHDAGIPEHPDEAHIEQFETFEENARAKADYFFRKSGLPTFTDDSGLVVHALGGRPGVRSKRWSERPDLDGEQLDAANNMKLLQELRALAPDTIPTAEYVCAAVFANDRETATQLGRTAGVIVQEPIGTQGFGYDPYFLSAELGVTFGEAETTAKNSISHRGRAFSSLLTTLFSTPKSSAPESDQAHE
jgi:XTP/dITP diphosphohydrolase